MLARMIARLLQDFEFNSFNVALKCNDDRSIESFMFFKKNMFIVKYLMFHIKTTTLCTTAIKLKNNFSIRIRVFYMLIS